MALPEATPMLHAFATGNLTRVDNVFCTPDLRNKLISCYASPANQPVKTDHFPITTIFDLRTTVWRNWKRVDWEEFREALTQKLRALRPPRELVTEQQFWTTLERLDAMIEEVVKEKVPITKPSPYQRRWWNEDLKNMRRQRNNLGNKAFRK
ncbi:hypothetical protein F5890DRAFT_1420886 [Lentinula detonsa]|uniref:Endonuclease/exonuclease/phosphatase domain-containing protein n=1 Tax=Lentinula detonsa TaxID=2804962 RepID=A0AA38UMQ8_9AGAR|nr:hypothetical protein F5890DRAFT_1420886 [Lentinula detonsa]